MIRPIWILIAREFHSQLRNGTFVLVGIVAPVLLASLFGFALGQGGDPEQAPIGVVDLDGGQFANSLQSEVLASEELSKLMRLRSVESVSAARGDVDAGDLAAVIVFPEGFSESVGEGNGGTVDVIELPSNPVAATMARTVVEQMSMVVNARTLAVRASLEAGIPAEDVQLFVEANGAAGPALTTVSSAASQGTVDTAVYYASGIAALFSFLVVGNSARSLLADRRIGVLGRIQASPVPAWAAVASKSVVGFVAAYVSMSATWLASVAIFGDSWGEPAAVLALFAAHCLAATALTMLIASGARTDAQADGYVLVLSFVFGFLGGSIIPLFQLPDLLQTLALFTPNGWTAGGLGSLVVSGGGIGTILMPIAVLIAIAATAGALATLRFRKGLLR